MSTDALLAERGETHGDFEVNAVVAQSILRAIQLTPGAVWGELDDVYREALTHIAGKIGRILSAPHLPNMEPDHWADIAGYARLAERHAIKQRNAAPLDTPGARRDKLIEMGLLAPDRGQVVQQPAEFDASC